MRLLGIDYGLKRIGLAVAEGGLPYPLEVILNQPGVVQKIKKICEKYQVEKIVLGLPDGKLKKLVEKFGQELNSDIYLPVVFQDETLTSREAIVKMVAAGKKRKLRRAREDAFAATLILQAYLTNKEN